MIDAAQYNEFLKRKIKVAGEIVLDPFMGIGTVPMLAIKQGRRGHGFELAADYFADAVAYCEAAAREIETPTLFDLAPAA